MSLRNNKKKNHATPDQAKPDKNPPIYLATSGKSSKREQKRAFVDILGGDDFQEYVNFLRSPKKTFFFNFLRGTGFGLGTILGTAIVLSIIVYIFSFFVKVPFLGEWLNKIFGNIKI